MEEKKQSTGAKLLRLAGRYKGNYILSIIFSVLGVAAGLLPYFAAAQMLVELIAGGRDFGFYGMWCGIAAGGFLLKSIFTTVSTNISHSATFKALRDVRKQLTSKFSRMPMGTLLDTPSGNWKDIFVDRVESMETTLAHLLPEMTANILVPIGIICYLFVLDWRMALVSLITIPVGMVFMMPIMKNYAKQYEGSVKVNQKMNSAIVEYVGGIEVIKAFNQSATSYSKYADAVNGNADYYYNWMKSCQWPIAAYKAICPAVLIAVLPVGVAFFLAGTISTATLITVIILSLGIVGPLIAASDAMDNLAIVGTVVGQVMDILDAPELVRPEKYAKLNGEEIRLNNVSFSYHADSDKAIEHINLTIKPNTVTALVGPSGSGKSTITKLIAGFWDVSEGTITLGGIDVKNIPLSQLSKHISYVSQDNYLFDDTVRENIRMGRKSATDEEVERAAKDAGCDGFIRNLENGYDTRVGGAGGHLSGGERQRIAIARALLKNAPIIILDEATAYIDPENEALIQKAVSKLVAGKTLIIVAHRLSTIIDSDQIVVMKGGKIQSVGTHGELLEKCPLYKEMWAAHIGAKDGENL